MFKFFRQFCGVYLSTFGASFHGESGGKPAIPIVLVRETIAAPGNEARATVENTNQRHGLPLLVRIKVRLMSMWSTPTEGRRMI